MNKNAFANILSAVNKMKEGSSSYADDKDKYWSCETDKLGNGQAVIRFLPSKDGESLPFIRKYSHGFKIGAKWYIDDCRTTIGESCPVCEANNELWNTGVKENQDIVRLRKRKQGFVANILVISDPKNPENEGKAFLWKFGKKIFDKIIDKMQPQFEDEIAINPFDAAEGADFKLRIRQVEGYANYDKSEFASVSDRSAQIDEVLEDIEDLQALIAPENFKSYADQKKRLDSVLSATSPKAARVEDEDVSDEDLKFLSAQKAKAKTVREESSPPWEDDAPKAKPKAAPKTDDPDMDYFASLAADD